MMQRVLPAGLVTLAVAADLGRHHSLALAALLAAVPAAFACALDYYGKALEARCSGARPLLAGIATLLLVVSAALRSPALVGGVPNLAVTCAVLALLVYASLAVGTLLQGGRAVPESA